MAQSISAPPRSRKGKQKAMEDDPIELYDDDSLSPDTFDRFDTPLRDDVPDVAAIRAESSFVAHPQSSTIEQSAEALYKKMLALRTSVSDVDMSFFFLFYSSSRSCLKSGLMTRRKSLMIWYCSISALPVLAVCIIILTYRNFIKSTALDYRSFKKEVVNGLDMDEPHSTNIAQQKWDQYGQKFLQLCIEHKTGSLEFVQ
jgi:hypothetical protein